eukprot:3079031-Rhodomonas_salina.2
MRTQTAGHPSTKVSITPRCVCGLQDTPVRKSVPLGDAYGDWDGWGRTGSPTRILLQCLFGSVPSSMSPKCATRIDSSSRTASWHLPASIFARASCGELPCT